MYPNSGGIKFTKAKNTSKVIKRSPGPGDYRPENFVKKHTPKFSFGGSLANADRFASGLHRELIHQRSPGPGVYHYQGGGIRPTTCPGAPKMGSASRFMADPYKKPICASWSTDSTSIDEMSHTEKEHDRPGE